MQQSTIPVFKKIYSVRYREGRSLADRFWSYVRVGAPDECWEWRGSLRKPGGYGQIGYYDIETKKQSVIGAHRVSWLIHHGPVPDDLWVLHKCDNPPCVNPYHLFVGTSRDNVNDCIEKGRFPKVPDPEARRAKKELRRQFGRGHKVTIEEVREIRRLFDAGTPYWAIAMQFDIHWTTALKIGQRKSRGDIV